MSKDSQHMLAGDDNLRKKGHDIKTFDNIEKFQEYYKKIKNKLIIKVL